jgi:hypothetical protein
MSNKIAWTLLAEVTRPSSPAGSLISTAFAATPVFLSLPLSLAEWPRDGKWREVEGLVAFLIRLWVMGRGVLTSKSVLTPHKLRVQFNLQDS